MKINIKYLFQLFIETRLNRYRLGDSKLYSEIDLKYVDQNCFNPFLKTEADVKVKFGGFIEEWLLKEFDNLTVHSELKLYPNTAEMADLSLHHIPKGSLWLNHDDIIASTRAIIEIKYANYRDPNYEFTQGYIEHDISKLYNLGNEIEKYLLILDEGNRISDYHIHKTRQLAHAQGIELLSNNPKF